jgi:hypothetical protein
MNEPAARLDRPNRTAYTIALSVLAIAFVVKGALVLDSCSRGKHRDYFRWHRVAQRVLADEPLAEPHGYVPGEKGEEGLKFYKLPPAFAVYIAPLGLLPYTAYVITWIVLSFASAVLAAMLLMRMLAGRFLPADARILLFPAFGAVAFVMDDVHNGTSNLFLLAMIVAGFALAAWSLRWLGGLSIGMAITWKAFPAPLLPVLVLTRRWRLAGWTLAGIVLWTLLVPGAIRGFARQYDETSAWFGRIIEPYIAGGEQRQWKTQGLSEKNLSLYAVTHRLLRRVDWRSGFDEGFPEDASFVNVLDLPKRVVNGIFAAGVAACMAAVGVVGLRRAPPKDAKLWACDGAIGACMILIASPIVWDYFLALLLLPMTVGSWLAVRWPGRALRRGAGGVWIASAVLIPLGLWEPARSVGVLAWLVVAWLVLMLVARPSLFRAAAGENVSGDDRESSAADLASGPSR